MDSACSRRSCCRTRRWRCRSCSAVRSVRARRRRRSFSGPSSRSLVQRDAEAVAKEDPAPAADEEDDDDEEEEEEEEEEDADANCPPPAPPDFLLVDDLNAAPLGARPSSYSWSRRMLGQSNQIRGHAYHPQHPRRPKLTGAQPPSGTRPRWRRGTSLWPSPAQTEAAAQAPPTPPTPTT